jgi:hypothetical protein
MSCMPEPTLSNAPLYPARVFNNDTPAMQAQRLLQPPTARRLVHRRQDSGKSLL